MYEARERFTRPACDNLAWRVTTGQWATRGLAWTPGRRVEPEGGRLLRKNQLWRRRNAGTSSGEAMSRPDSADAPDSAPEEAAGALERGAGGVSDSSSGERRLTVNCGGANPAEGVNDAWAGDDV